MDAIKCPKCDWTGTTDDLAQGRLIYESSDNRYDRSEYALECPQCGYEYSEGFDDGHTCDGCGEYCDNVMTTPEHDEYCYRCFQQWLEGK